MPIYEYQCTACGKDFERLQKFTDSPIQECPFCRGRVRKLLSNTSFHLKGTGWYVTDYARKQGGPHSQESVKKDAAKPVDSGPSSSETSSASTPAKEPSA